jgi:signal transduction histidine kinase
MALSLRTKVPLFIGVGLAVVIAVWTWVSYGNIRQVLTETGKQRLAAATPEVARIFRAQLRASWANVRTGLSRSAAVQGYIRSGGRTDGDSVRVQLDRSVTGANVRLALFALDGTPLIASPDTSGAGSAERHEELAGSFAAATEGPEFAGVGPLRRMRGDIVMPFVASIITPDSQPIALGVLWRKITGTEQVRDQLAGLIGSDAQVFIGNARGDLWTDVSGAATTFPVAIPFDGNSVEFQPDDATPVFAGGREIEGTPLAIAVTFSQETLMAPARLFLRRSITLGAFVTLVAAALAWLLSRRITSPLHALTSAAKAAAAGAPIGSVVIDRDDEIGQLSASFNRMAANVNESREALERKVSARTAELRERYEELEAFAHSISHDLRAPLRAMHGFSQALVEDCGEQLDDTGKDYVRRIATAAKRMDLLTQDLLAYSRVSRTEAGLSTVPLSAAVTSALEQLEADLKAHDAEVRVKEPLPHVLAHRALLEQAIANLVSNGAKFAAAGTRPVIQISAEPANGTIRLWVADNGIGIEPAHHERIFSVFERLHPADQYPGTGIGLAIVRKSAERMGGAAGVVSSPGAGSRFWIDLKAAEPA